jgi:lipopolysaccharide biosynthesis glycosyltransferase
MLTSAVSNSRTPLEVHVIHHGVEARNLEKLKAYLADQLKIKALYYEFDPEPYRHFRLDDHITLASYFRLFMTEILPGDLDRILYLDGDMVVRGDLTPLWTMNLGDALIGAAPDPFALEPSSNERLRLPSDHVHFNAGVLVIDLSKWRQENLLPKFVAYVEANHANLRYHDQDALNAVLCGRHLPLDYVWNFQARTEPAHFVGCRASPQQLAAWASDPRVVHFTSTQKPWLDAPEVAFRADYYQYLRQTPWRKYRAPDWSLRRNINRRLPLLGKVTRRLRQAIGR